MSVCNGVCVLCDLHVCVHVCAFMCVHVYDLLLPLMGCIRPGSTAGYQSGRGQLQADQAGPGPAEVHRGEVRALGVQGAGPRRGHGRRVWGKRAQEGGGGWSPVAPLTEVDGPSKQAPSSGCRWKCRLWAALGNRCRQSSPRSPVSWDPVQEPRFPFQTSGQGHSPCCVAATSHVSEVTTGRGEGGRRMTGRSPAGQGDAAAPVGVLALRTCRRQGCWKHSRSLWP